MASSRVVVFAEVRYCRRSGEVFYAGVLIEQVIYHETATLKHLADDEVSRYLEGNGLTAARLLQIREHLLKCSACASRASKPARRLHAEKRLPPRDMA